MSDLMIERLERAAKYCPLESELMLSAKAVIEQQQKRIAELEAKTSCCMGVGNSEGLSPLFARDIENMNEDDLITVFDRVTAELEKRSNQSKVIAQAEHEIESRTSEPAISTHLGILYDAGMLKLPEGD